MFVQLFIFDKVLLVILLPKTVTESISTTALQILASLGVGLQHEKNGKVRYIMRGKKAFPVTSNGLLRFNVKGRSDVDQEFKRVRHFMLLS